MERFDQVPSRLPSEEGRFASDCMGGGKSFAREVCCIEVSKREENYH
jgi:hypothetical protein